ncbi:MAG: hypothetical protein RI556_03775 [Hydrogenovibrio sp.]|uniref:hypothetical protein n=1 Tax=Hydrogenovibrio sp. TaxID=2065821 RepID=UPI002870AB2F|nr:hypothetical protein [Hydrogenovibrio sp.]MDR9498270.1 hypothetical protein [Hydrogenovibrio sp.]
MNSVNPTLASATQAMSQQANGLTDVLNNDPKVTDRQGSASSSGGNTTVTLSDQAQANAVQQVDYRDLAASQTVNANTAVEDANVNANQTTSGTTYASALASQSNYNAQQAQTAQTTPESNNTRADAQSVNMAEASGQQATNQDLV